MLLFSFQFFELLFFFFLFHFRSPVRSLVLHNLAFSGLACIHLCSHLPCLSAFLTTPRKFALSSQTKTKLQLKLKQLPFSRAEKASRGLNDEATTTSRKTTDLLHQKSCPGRKTARYPFTRMAGFRWSEEMKVRAIKAVEQEYIFILCALDSD